MSEPKPQIEVSTNASTGEVEIREVSLTDEERERRTRAGFTYYSPNEELTELARASTRMAQRQEVGRLRGAGSTFVTAAANAATGGLPSAFLSDSARQAVLAGEEARGEVALAGSLTGGLAGLPGLTGAVPIGRLAAARVAARMGQGGARAVAGLTEGVFGGTLTAIEQANINDEEISEHLLSNIGLGALFGVGGEALGGFAGVFGPRANRAALDVAEAADPNILRRGQHLLSRPFTD